MTNYSVEYLKNEIANHYIKKFVKELGLLKWIAILPIKTPMKDILIWNKPLPENFIEIEDFKFWKNVIQFLSPNLAGQIFDFLQTKREEIISRNTKAELEALYNEILWIDWTDNDDESENTGDSNDSGDINDSWENSWDTDNNTDQKKAEKNDSDKLAEEEEKPFSAAAVWALTSAWSLFALDRTKKFVDKVGDRRKARKIEKLSNSMDNTKLVWTIESAIDAMENQKVLLKSRLTPHQITTIENHIAKLKDWLEAVKAADIDNVKLLEDWLSLWDKFPKKLLWECTVSAKSLKIIKNGKCADELFDVVSRTRDAINGGRNTKSIVDQIHVDAIVEQMRKYLKETYNITDVSDEVLRMRAMADDAAEIATGANILYQWVKTWFSFKKFVDTFVWALWLDFAFAWIDVRNFINENREAEVIDKLNKVRGANKHNQALFHLMAGLSSIAIEWVGILISCAVTWSYWWRVWTIIWVAAWLIAWGVSEAWDALYFDVQDFYTQNKFDFLKQPRAQIKQAILQWIHNKIKWDTSANEKFTTWWNKNWEDIISQFPMTNKLGHVMNDIFNTDRFTFKCNSSDTGSWSEVRIKSLKSACASMIFLEELENESTSTWLYWNSYLSDYLESWKKKCDYLKDKNEEFQKEFNKYWEIMQDRIAIRMKYIEKELDNEEIINSIYKGYWAHRLTQVFTESIWYADMNKKSKWEDWKTYRDDSKTYDENLKEYKKELFKDFPGRKVEKLENLKKENPSLFLDVITIEPTEYIGEENNDEITEDDENKEVKEEKKEVLSDNYIENVKLVEKYKEYLSMVQNIEDREYLYLWYQYRDGLFVSNLLEADFDLDKVECETLGADNNVADILGNWYERRWITEISDNILQNILYGVAKELNGYSWRNELYDIMKFYSKDQDDVNWVYFDDKWIINNDWAIDLKLEYNIPEIIYEKDVDNYVDHFIKSNFYTPVTDENWVPLRDSNWEIIYQMKSCIDTPTESIDPQLTKEMIDTFEKIVREELTNHTEENKLRVKDEICNVVKKNSKWEFMELPYYLILDAKKAWLWDLQRQVFRWNDEVEYNLPIPWLELDDWNHIDVCYMDGDYNITSIDSRCSKYYLTSLRLNVEYYTEEEKYYIDRVDDAVQKLTNIMSVQWWGLRQKKRQEDDLDLPTDVERLISEKVKEWDKFKELILRYKANTCCSPLVLEQYTEYATYFENLYRWILLTISWFNFSNDIDSFPYFQQVMSCWYSNLFDKEWKIDTEISKKWKWFYFLGNTNVQNVYNKLLEEEVQVWDNKDDKESLKLLRKRWTDEQKELARQASYFIITTILEMYFLSIEDGSWKVKYIGHGLPTIPIGWNKNKLSPLEESIWNDLNIDEVRPKLQDYLSKKTVPPRISSEKIQSEIGNKKMEIKKMTNAERTVTDLTPIIEDQIRDNTPDVCRWYKRFQLRYDILEQKVESRGEKTKITLDDDKISMKIDWLDIEFNNIKEWIRVANLINWLKRNMKLNPIWTLVQRVPNKKELLLYAREWWSLIRDVKNDINDIEVLTEDIIGKWYPAIKDSNEFCRFVNMMLDNISKDNSQYAWRDKQHSLPKPSGPSIEVD